MDADVRRIAFKSTPCRVRRKSTRDPRRSRRGRTVDAFCAMKVCDVGRHARVPRNTFLHHHHHRRARARTVGIRRRRESRDDEKRAIAQAR